MDDFATGYAIGQNDSNNCGGGMWGGDGSWIFAFLIIALIFGGGGWGFGGGFGGWGGMGGAAGMTAINGYATRADINDGFLFNDLQRGIAGVSNGLCDGFYAMNTGMLNGFCNTQAQIADARSGLANTMTQGFAGLNTQISNGFNQATIANLEANHASTVAMMQGFNGVQGQIADCCCQNRYDSLAQSNATQRAIENGFCQTGYNAATNTTAIIQNQHNDTDRVLAKLGEMEAAHLREKNDTLREQLQNARFEASQQAQNNFLVSKLGYQCPVSAYVVQPPQQVTFPTNTCGGVNYGGCGCG